MTSRDEKYDLNENDINMEENKEFLNEKEQTVGSWAEWDKGRGHRSICLIK